MKIWSYTFTFPDETDILANTLNSLSRCVDKIILVDGGTSHAFVHNTRNSIPVAEWLSSRPEVVFVNNGKSDRSLWVWNATPLEFLYHEYVDPGSQRNFVLDWINSQAEKPDWVVALDSDEVLSLESELGMREYLTSLPNNVTNVVQPLLNLIQDEQHCAAGHHSDWLCHSRLHRPDAVHYNLGYHEHQTYQGTRVQWNTRIIHQRMLYRRRIWLQRGAPTLRSAWDDIQMVDVPQGVTWMPLVWPKEEGVVPFDVDVREYENGRYAK